MSVESMLIRERVIDTDSGIEPQRLPRIVDRFYSSPDHSDRSRAGLGLAIVKRIMDLYARSVRILSGKNTGTTVEVTLPRTAAGPQQTQSSRESIPPIVRSA